jgi:hypothetical protein
MGTRVVIPVTYLLPRADTLLPSSHNPECATEETMKKIYLSVVLQLFVFCLSAHGQNLLSNSHFDYRTTYWPAVSSPYIQIGWSDADALYSVTSGSLSITNTSPSAPSVVYVKQCVPVTGGTNYNFGAKVRILPFQLTTGRASVRVNYFSGTSCSGSQIAMVAQYPYTDNPAQRFISFGRAWPAPANAVSAEFQFVLQKWENTGSLTALFDDAFFAPSNSCIPDDSAGTLCLNERFAVSAKYTTDQAAKAHVVQLASDSGYLWFFSETNAEALVKVLDGCGLNHRYWVFAGGLTDVNVELTVTDKKTGAEKKYTNEAGHPFAPIQDTDAFASCD